MEKTTEEHLRPVRGLSDIGSEKLITLAHNCYDMTSAIRMSEVESGEIVDNSKLEII
jgi:hypothetical protein